MFEPVKLKIVAGANRFVKAAAASRLIRGQDGATAVEFALVVAPFFALLFAIIETALVFFATQTLETATSDAARQILTGQAQSQNYTLQQFTNNQVCPRLYALFSCGGILVDVRPANCFSTANVGMPINQSNQTVQNNFIYNPGGPGDIIVVRVMYEWPLWVTNMGAAFNFSLANLSDGNRLIMAATAFKNEPYGTNTSSTTSPGC